jgi:hypothetical protein
MTNKQTTQMMCLRCFIFHMHLPTPVARAHKCTHGATNRNPARKPEMSVPNDGKPSEARSESGSGFPLRMVKMWYGPGGTMLLFGGMSTRRSSSTGA